MAVVTPIVKFPLSAEEEISLRHLRQYLGSFAGRAGKQRFRKRAKRLEFESR